MCIYIYIAGKRRRILFDEFSNQKHAWRKADVMGASSGMPSLAIASRCTAAFTTSDAHACTSAVVAQLCS